MTETHILLHTIAMIKLSEGVLKLSASKNVFICYFVWVWRKSSITRDEPRL